MCLCPSLRCLRCMMAYARALTIKQQFIIRTALCTMTKLGRTQFWHALQKWLLSSCCHPWLNMDDHSTNYVREINMLSSTIQISWFSFSILRDLGMNIRFHFSNSHCIREGIDRATVLCLTRGNIYFKPCPNKRIYAVNPLAHTLIGWCIKKKCKGTPVTTICPSDGVGHFGEIDAY